MRREGLRPAALLVTQSLCAVGALVVLAGMTADWLRGLETDGEGWHVVALCALSLAAGTAYRQQLEREGGVVTERNPDGTYGPRQPRFGGRQARADWLGRQRPALVDALVTHQRREGGGGCHCGAVGLGESYPEHVADVVLGVLEVGK